MARSIEKANQTIRICQSGKEKYPASVVTSSRGILTVSASDISFGRDHIFVFRLTSNKRQAQMNEMYIAVPNGGKITLRDVPEGSYRLSRMI